MQQVPQELQYVAPYLDQYGYPAILLGVMLEDFGVPAPGETLLIAGAAFAGLSGGFSIWLVILLGLLGAVVGDNIGFAIGHFGGRNLVLRFGRYVFIKEEQLDRIEGFFDRHGGKVVTVARFVEGLRQLNGIAAGTAGMSWRRFLAFNILGAALWVGVWGSVGYFFGNRLDVILVEFRRYEIYFIVGAVLLIGLAVAYRLIQRKRGEGRS